MATALLIMMVLALLVVRPAPAAMASCVTSHPPRSPYAFVGTVIDTDANDRIATVVTDDGTRVTVDGLQAGGRFFNSISEVDRRFAVGARYEFHPLNGKSPYRDNSCTATRKLAGPAVPPLPAAPKWLPAWLPVDEQAGPLGYALVVSPVIAVLVAGGLLGRRAWRRRHRDLRSG
jgi:hypothetical protein